MTRLNIILPVALAAIALLVFWLMPASRAETGTVTGPLTVEESRTFAARTAVILGGSWHDVSPDSESMGAAVSASAHVVLVRRWHLIQPGDVIGWRGPDGGAILHRAVHQNDGRWRTAGDNNRRSDGVWVDEADYLGTLAAQFYYSP